MGSLKSRLAATAKSAVALTHETERVQAQAQASNLQNQAPSAEAPEPLREAPEPSREAPEPLPAGAAQPNSANRAQVTPSHGEVFPARVWPD